MTEAPPWSVGDVARLKSGGPKMTVTNLTEARGEALALCRCAFFADGKLTEVLLPEASLIHEEPVPGPSSTPPPATTSPSALTEETADKA